MWLAYLRETREVIRVPKAKAHRRSIYARPDNARVVVRLRRVLRIAPLWRLALHGGLFVGQVTALRGLRVGIALRRRVAALSELG